MPDYPTSGPTAGWYTDPADPGQERWWGGAEWTHETRVLQAAAAPELATVPDDGANPYAALIAEHTAMSTGGQYASAPASTGFASLDYPQATPAVPQTGFATDTGFGTQSQFGTQSGFGTQSQFGTQSSFGSQPFGAQSYGAQQARMPMALDNPTNTTATVGLILSLLGFGLLGIGLSISALRKAREFEARGEEPVGRTRGRWGVGIGLVWFAISIALALVITLTGSSIYDLYRQQTGAPSSSGLTDGQTVETALPVLNDDGTVAVYDRATYEATFAQGFVQAGSPAPESVVCPDQVDMVVGNSFVCSFVYQGEPHSFGMTFTGQTEAETTLDGVVQE